MRRLTAFFALLVAITVLPVAAPTMAQGAADSAALDAQRAAMGRLAMLDGEWRGPSQVFTRQGPQSIIQTERVGTMLDGTIRVVEGRGYAADGGPGFNAFAVISYDPPSDTFTMHSWAQGRSGSFTITVTDTGFTWQVPAGPGAHVAYVAIIEGDSWHEVGTFVREGAPPVPVVEMHLTRLGDSDWPQSGSVASQ